MDKTLLEQLKQKLEKDKETLEKELEVFAKKDERLAGDWDTRYPKSNGGNLEEEAGEVEEYEALLPIEHSLETKLANVKLALEKFKKEKYGICEKCSKPIDENRLRAMPEAKICLKCQD